MGINFCDFQKVPDKSLEIFSVFSLFLNNTIVRLPFVHPILYTVLFLNERLVIKQTQFLSTVFLCSEFKLENI